MLIRERVFDPVSGEYFYAHRRAGRRGNKEYLNKNRWKRLRLEVFARDRYECQGYECQRLPRVRRAVRLGTGGKKGTAVCDHIVPVWQGGDQWDIDNLQTLCISCHIKKTRVENKEYVRRYGVYINGRREVKRDGVQMRERSKNKKVAESRERYDALLESLLP